MNHTQSQSKTFKRTASLELSRWYMGIALTNLVEKKDNGGAFSLLEATLVPGNEPPPHVHSREDELFYVLEGEFDVYVGEEAFNVTMSECIFLPKFRPHAIVIRSPRLRVLILYTPGGLEEAFSKMSSPAQNLEPPTEALTYSQSDSEQTARRFGEYGVQILSPEEVAEQLPLYPKPHSVWSLGCAGSAALEITCIFSFAPVPCNSHAWDKDTVGDCGREKLFLSRSPM